MICSGDGRVFINAATPPTGFFKYTESGLNHTMEWTSRNRPFNELKLCTLRCEIPRSISICNGFK